MSELSMNFISRDLIELLDVNKIKLVIKLPDETTLELMVLDDKCK